MIGVLALVRDEEQTLPRFFAEMENLENMMDDEIVYSFYENDSKDNSPSIVSKFLRQRHRRGSLVSETLGLRRFKGRQQERTELMAMGRNIALSQLKMFDPDVLLVIDPDIDFSYEHILQLLPELDNNEVVMACASTMQDVPSLFGDSEVSYYDSWAFIASDDSPGITFAHCPSILKEDQEQWKREQRITARSAFGGIAVLRYDDVLQQKAQWDGSSGCEHWSFCKAMVEIGDIIVRADVNPMVIHRTSTTFGTPTPAYIEHVRETFIKHNGGKA
jgi:glycosyltransferase involved in cell wall biosynthesis